MQLFGYALPFLGFRKICIDWDGEPRFDVEYSGFESDALICQWFGVGFILYIGKIRKSE